MLVSMRIRGFITFSFPTSCSNINPGSAYTFRNFQSAELSVAARSEECACDTNSMDFGWYVHAVSKLVVEFAVQYPDLQTEEEQSYR
jgi:hypothetical protein